MRALLAVPAVLLATPAAAEVVKSDAAGFVVEHRLTIAAPPMAVWDMIRAPQKWWLKDHTWTGDAANLYLDSQATGCFCERLPNRGSVEHAHIVYAAPGSLLRLKGELGPLQAEAVNGTLTFALVPEGDSATRLTVSYAVGGYARDGMAALAPLVDQVIGAQAAALRAAVAPAPPPPPAAEPDEPEKPRPGSLELDLQADPAESAPDPQ